LLVVDGLRFVQRRTNVQVDGRSLFVERAQHRFSDRRFLVGGATGDAGWCCCYCPGIKVESPVGLALLRPVCLKLTFFMATVCYWCLDFRLCPRP
jgi:hypothetical protein